MDQQRDLTLNAVDGEIGVRLRDMDWSVTPFDGPERWPQSFRSTLSICLGSPVASALYWGPDFRMFYNDAYAPVLAGRHPEALAQPLRDVWSEAWDALGPQLTAVMDTGQGFAIASQRLLLRRGGGLEETFWDYSFTPVRGEDDATVGIFVAATDTTHYILAERRRVFLLALADQLRVTDKPGTIVETAIVALGRHLAAHRVGFGHVQPDDETIVLESNYVDGVAPLIGSFSLDGFGANNIALQRRGLTVVRDDVQADPSNEAGGFAAVQTRSFVSVPLIRHGRFKALLIVNQRDVRHWSHEDVHLIEDVAARIWDAVERARAEEARRVDAEFLRSVLASSSDCIKVLDLDAKLVFMSEGGQRTMEVGDFSAIRGCSWPDFWRDAMREDAKAAVEAARAGLTGHFQGPSDTMAGNPRYWDVQVTPILGADRQPERLLSVSRDITEAKRSEDALRGAEGLNTLILNSSRDCIVVLDLDGNNLFISPGGIEAMEVSDVAAVLGLSWLRVWKDADQEAAQSAVATARAGSVGRFRGYCPTHKGTPKWWDVVISPLPGRDGRPERLVSVGRDITKRVLAEQQLAFSEESLRLATDAAQVGTWDLDLRTGVLTWSDRTKSMFGISPNMPCSMDDFYAGLHPDDASATAEAFASALDPARRGTYDVEYRTVGKEDGVVRWIAAKGSGIFDGEGRCVRALGTAIDISARRAVDERLRTSEAQLRELNAGLETRVEERTRERDKLWALSEDLLAVADYEGHLLRVSPSWTRVFGYPEHILLTRPYAEIVHPDDFGAVMGALLDMRSSGRPVSFENRVLAEDGSWRWIAWTLSPEPGGERLSGVGRDITDEKTRRAELEATQEALRQSQKMEAVGQLTGGLAHDFNNLLAGISGSLELLQSRLSQGRFNDLERYISAAQGASKRAAALTHRLLAFSRRQTLDPKPTSVNSLITGMEELIRRTIGPAIALEVVGAGGLWMTMVDPSQLENALLNLCINGRDAMPDGGRITIETANRWLDPRTSRERELEPGQYVSLCVSDTGTGMPPDVIARAFEPFFTTKPLGMGTGLGLSMIYGFAKQSGGQVRIYSEIDQGTMVCLYLPRHRGEAVEQPASSEHAEVSRAGSGQTVLIVDDEPTLRMLITEVLEDLGYTAIEAADGPAGLRVLQSKTRIDLLVTDVGLPGGMNGRQVADAGRALRPGLKVLFITGYAENAVVGHGHLDHGMRILTKPFGMDELAHRIQEIVSEP